MWLSESLTDNSHLRPKDPTAYYAKLQASILRRNEQMREQARCLVMLLTNEEWDRFVRRENLRREEEGL